MEPHHNFKLNGSSFTREELISVGYSLIKEGEPFEVAIGDFLLDWLSNSRRVQVKTSGSTGKPKTIFLDKEQMVNSALATGKFFGLSEKDTALLCLSAEYIAGKMMLVRAMVLGWHLDYVVPDSTPLQTTDKSYDFCAMVPLQLEHSLSQLSQIKTLIVGGAPVPRMLQEKRISSKTEIYETYGMTETITHIAARPFGNACFKVLPGVGIDLDERGCLGISVGYLGIQRLVTNDMAQLVSQKEFMLLGRYDNVINSGGIKIFPEQLEAKLSNLIVSNFFITGIPDKKFGQKVVLVLEGNQNPKDLQQYLKEKGSLSKYEVPKEFYTVPKFVMTKTGKLDRKQTLSLLGL